MQQSESSQFTTLLPKKVRKETFRGTVFENYNRAVEKMLYSLTSKKDRAAVLWSFKECSYLVGFHPSLCWLLCFQSKKPICLLHQPYQELNAKPITLHNGHLYVITLQRRYVMTFSPHANDNTKHLNHVHVSTKIEANQSIRPQWQKTA